jgi:dTDP-glucose 4,6-dehydratase
MLPYPCSQSTPHLGFRCDTDFDTALERTVRWYVENEPWWRAIKEKSEEYKAFHAKQYGPS